MEFFGLVYGKDIRENLEKYDIDQEMQEDYFKDELLPKLRACEDKDEQRTIFDNEMVIHFKKYFKPLEMDKLKADLNMFLVELSDIDILKKVLELF